MQPERALPPFDEQGLRRLGAWRPTSCRRRTAWLARRELAWAFEVQCGVPEAGALFTWAVRYASLVNSDVVDAIREGGALICRSEFHICESQAPQLRHILFKFLAESKHGVRV